MKFHTQHTAIGKIFRSCRTISTPCILLQPILTCLSHHHSLFIMYSYTLLLLVSLCLINFFSRFFPTVSLYLYFTVPLYCYHSQLCLYRHMLCLNRDTCFVYKETHPAYSIDTPFTLLWFVPFEVLFFHRNHFPNLENSVYKHGMLHCSTSSNTERIWIWNISHLFSTIKL